MISSKFSNFRPFPHFVSPMTVHCLFRFGILFARTPTNSSKLLDLFFAHSSDVKDFMKWNVDGIQEDVMLPSS